MSRSISENFPAVAEDPAHVGPFDDAVALRSWLAARAGQHGLSWLLTHADNGVNWGICRDGAIATSHDALDNLFPALDPRTLRAARLFAERAELLLWRVEDQWWERLIRDAGDQEEATWSLSLDEPYILWGTDGEDIAGTGFVLMSDGAQGLCHAVPCPEAAGVHGRDRPLRLHLRHYVESDEETGLMRIVASRLRRLALKEDDR